MKKLLLTSSVLFTLLACNTNQKGIKGTAGNAQYSTYQQVFCLNMLSNISGMYNYLSSQAISDSTVSAVDSVLTDPKTIALIGHWQTVWGPVVYSNIVDDSLKPVAVNTMFIAQSLDDTSEYVIAIAGTNPQSITAWTTEDLDFTSVINWTDILNGNPTAYTGPNVNTGVPFVSHGTFTGLDTLLHMQDPNRNNITAVGYLTKMAAAKGQGTPATIWVTGHSLGGALAPTMALYLNDTKKTVWGTTDTAISIHCLAVAGATPGGAAFSTYYNNELGANTIRVWNSHDVVPHGFDTVMLYQVDSIYNADSIQTSDTIKRAIYGFQILLKNYYHEGLIIKSNPYNYTQLYPSANGNCYDTVFTSGFYDTNNVIQTGGKLPNPSTFTGQLGAQHIPSYPHYFGVDSFQTTVQNRRGFLAPFFSFGYHPAPILSVQADPACQPKSTHK